MKKSVVRYVCLSLILLLPACGSSPPNNHYLLTARQTEAPTTDTPALGIGPIVIPEYLNRNNLVYDQRNNKFFQDLKSLYTTRWKAYKDNFLSGSSSDKTINLKCLAHHLYAKNEANILKKVLLAECYQQTVAKDAFKDVFDQTIDKLPVNSTLLKAM